MATFTGSDDLRGAHFLDADLSGARFVGADLSGVRMRGVQVSVDGEWSFAQTLRHLVLATDAWVGRAVLELDQPFHPLGLAGPTAADDGLDPGLFTTSAPTYAEVLDARAGRVATVRDVLSGVTAEELARPRRNPWSPQHPETTLSCLHVVLEEEWEHLRYAVRDLDAVQAAPPAQV